MPTRLTHRFAAPLTAMAAAATAAAAALGPVACASSGAGTPRAAAIDSTAMRRVVPIEFRDGAVLLKGTLYLPAGAGPHPAVVMTHASGAQTRDANRSLAEAFANAGIAALTYDKRGSGSSTGNLKAASFADLTADAAEGAIALRARRDIDGARIGIYARGQGATWSPMVAERDATIAFIVAVGASGVETDSLSRWLYDADAHWRSVNGAVMLAWGANDRRVPVEQSRSLIVGSLKRDQPRQQLVCLYPGADEALGAGAAAGPGLPAAFVQDVTRWVREVVRLDRPPSAGERRYSPACT
ncbi:MAG: CocE/NonD family hydrolase [Gemmatimonadota bacterium]|nr:CocE/NonD family hydrolase [Gemmatimonadota bacterium]